jgi:hypothetical protein
MPASAPVASEFEGPADADPVCGHDPLHVSIPPDALSQWQQYLLSLPDSGESVLAGDLTVASVFPRIGKRHSSRRTPAPQVFGTCSGYRAHQTTRHRRLPM